MSRDVTIYLLDIQERCQKIIRYSTGMTYEDFRDDERTLEAIERNFTIVGEAVKHLPQEFREHHLTVDWRGMAGLRDVVIHQYFGIQYRVLWDIIRDEVPKFLEDITVILDAMPKR